MKKITIISILLISIQAFSGNLGTYYPFPEQEEPVEVLFTPNETWAITKTNIMLEVKGFFSSKYKSVDTITCAIDKDNKIWIGTTGGLLSFDKKTFEVAKVALPNIENVGIVDLFRDKKRYIWICTKDNGVFSTDETGEILLQTAKTGIVTGAVLTTGTVGLIGETGFHYFLKSFWHSMPDSLYNLSSEQDKATKMFVDKNGYFWVISEKNTKVYELQTSVGKSDTLVLQNNFTNDGNQIIDFVSIPELGIIYATKNGFFFNYRPFNLNPLLEFVDSSESNKLIELLKRDITVDFARETGYRRATKISYDPDADKIWLVNSNGALGIPLKVMKKFLD